MTFRFILAQLENFTEHRPSDRGAGRTKTDIAETAQLIDDSVVRVLRQADACFTDTGSTLVSV